MTERDDADQEGLTLPPFDQTRYLARIEAQRAVTAHAKDCPLFTLCIEPRLRTLETRFALLIGLMIGSGLIGGIAGAALQRCLP